MQLNSNMEELENDVNSEIRYLTIELMKLADKNKKSFKDRYNTK